MSEKSFIDSVKVASPCTEDWQKMRGNDRVRFCDHCAKEVNDLSAITRREAMRLVRGSGGSICIRYIKHADHDGPIFSNQLVQIARRAPGIAAGVMSASLGLTSLTYAQGGFKLLPAPKTLIESRSSNADVTATQADVDDTSRPTTLSGFVLDANGARVPDAAIALIGETSERNASMISDQDGEFRFGSLTRGNYIIRVSAPGFAEYTSSVLLDGERSLAISLEVSIIELTVEVNTSGESEISEYATVGVVVIEYRTPLLRAVANDEADLVRDLIAKGERVNRNDDDLGGITPLFLAVENNNIEIARLLIEAGARVNARDHEQQTPLMEVDSETAPELVALLINSGAEVDLTDEEGNTALMFAASDSESGVLRVMIDAGASIDLTNAEGVSALMRAAQDDMVDNVRLLLYAGANATIRNNEGKTAWDMTTDSEIRDLLVSFGAPASGPADVPNEAVPED